LIRELLTYLSESPSLKEAKTFGHLSESISLLSREERCSRTWSTHRAECKQFIERELKIARHYESVLILGSGPLHEIPIDLLARTFKQVSLVDVVHLKSIKMAHAHLKNVHFIEHEITEIEAIVGKEKKLVSKIPTTFLDKNWGLILSINIMSQLPIHFETYIQKKLKNKFSNAEVECFLQDITKNHFAYLKAFSTPALLITDVETRYYDKKENLIQTDINYPHLALPKPVHEWVWNVAPIPEFSKDIGIKMLVSGFVLK
jgi:hypothetical protein